MGNDVPKSGDSWVPYPWSLRESSKGVKELIGRKVRLSSGPVSMEIDPGRVTIIVDANSIIRDIYIDQDRPTS